MNVQTQIPSILIVVFSVLLAACQSTPDYAVVHSNAQSAYHHAETHVKKENYEEAVKMLNPVMELHPNDPSIRELEQEIPEEKFKDLTESSMLGYNQTKAIPARKGILAQILLYLPDRILDLLDIVSMSVNVGPQIGAGFWTTRAIQAVAFTGSTVGLGWYQKRQLGLKTNAAADLAIGPVGASALSANRVGTGLVDSTSEGILLHTPGHDLYQTFRDYWGIGAEVGLALFGFRMEFHPVELGDFFVGLFTFDFLRDDFASSRSPQFTELQYDTYKALNKNLGNLSPNKIRLYKDQYPDLFPERANESQSNDQ